MTYAIIADGREAQVLAGPLHDFLTTLTDALATEGVVLQQWAMDDEMVLSLGRRRLSAKQVARRIDAHANLREIAP